MKKAIIISLVIMLFFITACKGDSVANKYCPLLGYTPRNVGLTESFECVKPNGEIIRYNTDTFENHMFLQISRCDTNCTQTNN